MQVCFDFFFLKKQSRFNLNRFLVSRTARAAQLLMDSVEREERSLIAGTRRCGDGLLPLEGFVLAEEPVSEAVFQYVFFFQIPIYTNFLSTKITASTSNSLCSSDCSERV